MFELWTEAVRSIEPMVKPAHRDLWLRPIECVGIDEGRIRLRAPNRYHKEWFEDNFLPSILKDLEARAQRAFTVDFEVAEEDAIVLEIVVHAFGVREGAEVPEKDEAVITVQGTGDEGGEGS